MEKIVLLTDYLGHFESKQKSVPKYSGLDKDLLVKEFAGRGYEIQFTGFSDIDFRRQEHRGQIFLYTSSEDPGFIYKDYIEDIIYGLTLRGARVIPGYPFLRANNNKVFMEIMRDLADLPELKNIRTWHFGTLEDLQSKIAGLPSETVIKPASGAMSKGVSRAAGQDELLHHARKLSRTRAYFSELWDLKNTFKYKGFRPGSRYRRKFIVQNLVKGLDHDWKVLVYGSRYFILRRENRPNDFRASGSGILSFTEDIPSGILDFASVVYRHFGMPNLSLDIATEGNTFYLLEFQALYFGTYTLEESPFHYRLTDGGWQVQRGRVNLENIYAESICTYLEKKTI